MRIDDDERCGCGRPATHEIRLQADDFAAVIFTCDSDFDGALAELGARRLLGRLRSLSHCAGAGVARWPSAQRGVLRRAGP
jgi:hypothetical protein